MSFALFLVSACIPGAPGDGWDGGPDPRPDAGHGGGPDAAPDAGHDGGPPEACEPSGDFRKVPANPGNLPDVPLTTQERLGLFLFFDPNLSTPRGQSCADCHLAETGWTGPNEFINATGSVYEGAFPGRFGNRKPPSSAYATDAPIFGLYRMGEEDVFAGGNFWDGRATGEKLGNAAADQAQGPPLNPVEQNNGDVQTVCERIRNSTYPREQIPSTNYEMLFEEVYGPGALDCEVHVQRTYDFFALAIAAWEDSCQVNAFSSKYDAYLARKARLTDQEMLGLELFRGKAMCSNCHDLEPGPHGEPPLFTDFTYDNIGVPPNPCNPWYEMPPSFNPLGRLWLDLGLALSPAILEDFPGYASGQLGKMKVPTLRNVDRRPWPDFIKAYTHNGFFKTLEAVVHFYNTRDVLPACEDIPGISHPITEEVALQNDCWPAAEVPIGVNTQEIGDLGLTAEEEAALVAFLETLSDGYTEPRGCRDPGPGPMPGEGGASGGPSF
jgi:cytochrome c peroxidase